MAKRCCSNCIYCVTPKPVEGIEDLTEPQVILPVCANCADCPGRLVQVLPGQVCRNFHVRRRPSKPTARVVPPEPSSPEIRHIGLTQGKYAIVDATDHEQLSRHKWYAMRSKSGHYYAVRHEKRQLVLMHREIMNPPPGTVVDHINHNTLNNRQCNLRVCTARENTYNRRNTNRSSGFAGVTPQGDKWAARVNKDGKVFHVGLFDDRIAAAKARDRKAVELFGQFAYLNFPHELAHENTAKGGFRIVSLRGVLCIHSRAAGVLSLHAVAG